MNIPVHFGFDETEFCKLHVGEQIRQIVAASEKQVHALCSGITELRTNTPKQIENFEALRRNTIEVLEGTGNVLRKIDSNATDPAVLSWRDLLLDFYTEVDHMKTHLNITIPGTTTHTNLLINHYNATVDVNKKFKLMSLEANKILELTTTPLEIKVCLFCAF